MIAGATLAFYSCTKENRIKQAPTQQVPVHVDNDGLSTSDLKVNALIKNFRQKIAYYRENPTLKNGESLPADSALWYLEATINYSHCFPNEYYVDFEIDTAYLSISKDANGEVDIVELSQKYEELKTKVSTLYQGSAYENKVLAVVDLKESSQNNSGIVFIAETVTGNKGTEPPNPVIDGPFEEGDDWWYGELAGLCIENDNFEDESDAAEELFALINDEIPDPNGNYFFINHVDYDIEGGDPLIQRDPTPDNHTDYYLFFASTQWGPCGEDTLCVEYPEMNIYFSYLKTLIFSYLPANVPTLYGKSIEVVTNIDGDFEYDNPYMKYKHHLYTIYGKKVFYKAGEEGPIEL
jgi:hypothetical protein